MTNSMSNLVEELRAIHEELVSMAQVFDKPEIFKRYGIGRRWFYELIAESSVMAVNASKSL